MIWLWAGLIVVGAAIACGLLYLFEKRKSIFKKRSKEEKAAKKQQRKLRRQARAAKAVKNAPAPIEEVKKEEPKEEVSFTEKVIKKEEAFEGQKAEAYVPSEGYLPKQSNATFNSPPPQRRMPRMTEQQRRALMERNRRLKEDDDFERFRNKHGYSNALKQGIKQQILNLSPEMKALLLTGALERPDDEEF